MRVEFSRRARREADQAFDYLMERSPLSAGAFAEELRRATELLAKFSRSGVRFENETLRVITLKTFPYRVFY